MSNPSSQVIALWVKENLQTNWEPLRSILVRTLQKQLKSKNDTEIYDCADQNILHVAEHLRNEASEWLIDGTMPLFEIDEEPEPYLRIILNEDRNILIKLRKIDPFDFEKLCASILDQLGAFSHVTERTNDGGVDFIGKYLNIVPLSLGLPISCKATVIGQAKRYKMGNPVKESNLREFVGAATLYRHELRKENSIGPLTPIIYAFWTTSDFDQNAKRYARAIGLWYMEGRTLANYLKHLKLDDKF